MSPGCPDRSDRLRHPARGVVAVVVTYRAALPALRALLVALSPQVDRVLVVENGPAEGLPEWLKTLDLANLHALFLGENRGLAAAQNAGIAEARKLGAEFVLLSDQDSLPAADMVDRLLAVACARVAAGDRLAAVGPRYFDVLEGSLRPFVQIRGLRVRRLDCVPGEVVEVDHLIASGCLIPVAALDALGPMNEDLFIDYVDTEWCLRAWRRGYRLYGVCDAAMRHGLGEAPNRFLGRYVPVHGPQRHYYLFRNAVWLYRQGWIPLTWKLATGLRLFLKLGYFAVFGPQRLAQLRMMGRGLRDGLRGRMGAAPA